MKLKNKHKSFHCTSKKTPKNLIIRSISITPSLYKNIETILSNQIGQYLHDN